MTYKYIRRLWSNSSPYADKESDSGDGKSENDDQIDSHLDDNVSYFYTHFKFYRNMIPSIRKFKILIKIILIIMQMIQNMNISLIL